VHQVGVSLHDYIEMHSQQNIKKQERLFIYRQLVIIYTLRAFVYIQLITITKHVMNNINFVYECYKSNDYSL
jgi:hypothetical protein